MTTVGPARPRVLIVEDNVLISMDLQHIVEEAGCEVSGATTDVARALAILEKERVDCALVDCKLENEDCSRVVAALRARNIPFVICSVVNRAELKSLYPDATIITKPYQPDEVTEALIALGWAELMAPS
jgi:CheY-like chemotaxis protein